MTSTVKAGRPRGRSSSHPTGSMVDGCVTIGKEGERERGDVLERGTGLNGSSIFHRLINIKMPYCYMHVCAATAHAF